MKETTARNDDEIARDGETVRVPLYAMDTDPVQREIAGQSHRPGYRTATTSNDAREQAHADYVRRTEDAWRTAPPTEDRVQMSDLDAAASEYERRLTSAWKGGRP